MIYPMDAIAGRAMIRTDALLNLPVVRAAVGDDDAAMRSFQAALQRAGAARLVDVRTEAEWTYVGRVDGVPLVQWRAFGAQQPNPRFVEQLAAQVPRDVPVMFLCRSGVRSQSAAKLATDAGWRVAMNVLEGFEGDLDSNQQRGSVGGWRKAGLPGIQS